MKIAITAGEPAGIGADLCALLANESIADQLVILGDRDVIAARAACHGVDIGTLQIEHIAVATPVQAGVLDVRNAPYVLELLDARLQAAYLRIRRDGYRTRTKIYHCGFWCGVHWTH